MESKKQSILTLLKNRTENYSEKVALGMKNQYGWKETTKKTEKTELEKYL